MVTEERDRERKRQWGLGRETERKRGADRERKRQWGLGRKTEKERGSGNWGEGQRKKETMGTEERDKEKPRERGSGD